MFLTKLMRNLIDCPEFLQLLPTRLPVHSAHENALFYLPFQSNETEMNSLLYAICNEVNNGLKCALDIDIFNSPLSLISNEILLYLLRKH